MGDAQLNLRDLTLSELVEFLGRLEEPRYRAVQIARWVFQKGAASLAEMTDLSANLRRKLAQDSYLSGLFTCRRQVSVAGDTVKYLFGLVDNQAIESVFLSHRYGRSACLSTQVGCRMGCVFCASSLGGVVRNLTPGEMYDQVLTIQKDTGQRISHLILMGSGEPLDNLENVLKFLANVSAPYGLQISYRRITISTCGLAPQIKELARHRLPLTLAVSLHAPDDALRNRLVPVNRRYPLRELLPACREYARATGRRVTFEYTLLAGVNDHSAQAARLGSLLAGFSAHVNLIPGNPVVERGFHRPVRENVQRFKNLLVAAGLNVTVRREMGGDIDAACGQLRWRAGGAKTAGVPGGSKK